MDLSMIKKNEGLRLKMYKCSAGANTIGWGFNLDQLTITEEIAEMLFEHSVRIIEKELNSNLPLYQYLRDGRRLAILDMAFQMGVPRLMGFINMIAALSENDYDVAADEMLDSDWARKYTRRASKDAQMMRSGKL